MKFYNEMMSGLDMLKKAKGNLFDLAENSQFHIVVHGCNCFNAMRAGIAQEIRERYPNAAEVDMTSVHGDYNKLGNWTQANAGPAGSRFTIINAYTQYGFSRGDDVFEYTSFELILKKLAHFYPGNKFGFPLIGCGLAGGDKDRIVGMLEAFAKVIDNAALGGSVTLVEFS